MCLLVSVLSIITTLLTKSFFLSQNDWSKLYHIYIKLTFSTFCNRMLYLPFKVVLNSIRNDLNEHFQLKIHETQSLKEKPLYKTKGS